LRRGGTSGAVETQRKILILEGSCISSGLPAAVKSPMKPEKKKRVYFEQPKATHTTHWDLDYLSQADLDALYAKNRREGGFGDSKPKWPTRRKILVALLAGATAVLLLLILALVLG
jgi:hypothetical protein